jgi:head-tail adaptor
VIGQQIRADNTHAVTMRRMAGVTITPKHRLLFQGRVLNITQVNDVGERRRELAILCTEVTTP